MVIPMRAFSEDKNPCNDKWLSALVDTMGNIEELRADDICRAISVPAGLMAQLHGHAATATRSQRAAPIYLELA
jgi:hypothetical protein